MFTLEARATQSAYASWLSPLLALALTAITGALIFLAMGKSPGIALYIYFIEPPANKLSNFSIVICRCYRAP